MQHAFTRDPSVSRMKDSLDSRAMTGVSAPSRCSALATACASVFSAAGLFLWLAAAAARAAASGPGSTCWQTAYRRHVSL